MRYYKIIDNGYITAIGTGGGGTEIVEAEYNTIMSTIQRKPSRTKTTDFRLKGDLTWEEYDRPPDIDIGDGDPEEVANILLGEDTDNTDST